MSSVVVVTSFLSEAEFAGLGQQLMIILLGTLDVRSVLLVVRLGEEWATHLLSGLLNLFKEVNIVMPFLLLLHLGLLQRLLLP